jgi:hypothetical protein
VAAAVVQAMQLGAISFDAVKHLNDRVSAAKLPATSTDKNISLALEHGPARRQVAGI